MVKGMKSSEEVSNTLVEYALKNGSSDNISVMTLKFAS